MTPLPTRVPGAMLPLPTHPTQPEKTPVCGVWNTSAQGLSWETHLLPLGELPPSALRTMWTQWAQLILISALLASAPCEQS